MKILKSLTVLSLILISSTVSARPSEIEMADAMLENGKIYQTIQLKLQLKLKDKLPDLAT